MQAVTKHKRGNFRQSILENLESRTLLSTVVVNSSADPTGLILSSTYTLRRAINIANASSTPTTITFDPSVFASVKTIALDASLPYLSLTNTHEGTTIVGPTKGVKITYETSYGLAVNSGVTASASSLVFSAADRTHTDITNAGTLTLVNVTSTGSITDISGGLYNSGKLTLQNCNINSHGDGNSALTAGAGLYNAGTVIANNTLFDNNNSINGGAIYQSGGSITITGCTFDDNAGTDGVGGTIDVNGGTMKMTNSTLTNSSLLAEGGVSQGGISIYLASSTIASLFDSTIDHNFYEPLGQAGLVESASITVKSGASLTLANTIVADTIDDGGTVVVPDVEGSVHSSGHNFIGKTSSGGWVSSDIKGTLASPLSAKLGSLASNGGPTQTLMPTSSSPVINAGSNSLIPSGVTTDQRGYNRIAGTVDIGAVEYLSTPTGTGGINGSIYDDKNSNGSKDSGEGALSGFTAYIDVNKVGHYVPGDPTAVTNGSGQYSFAKLAAGSYVVGAETPAGWRQTPPPGPLDTVTVGTTAASAAAFGFTQNIWINGTVFKDTNKNGALNSGEPGQSGWVVYIDANHNGKLDSGEVSVTTNSSGYWSIQSLPAGSYTVRIVLKSGWSISDPSSGFYTFNSVGAGGIRSNVLFGVHQ